MSGKELFLIRNLNVSGGRHPWGKDNYFYLKSNLCLEGTEYFKHGLTLFDETNDFIYSNLNK